jgi:hypothetical protein
MVQNPQVGDGDAQRLLPRGRQLGQRKTLRVERAVRLLSARSPSLVT